MHIEQKIAKLLTQKQETLAVAESCTGGLLANRLTNIPGSSRFFQFGIVAYANEAKMKLLNLPQKTIRKFGAVSPQVAELMAKRVRKLLKCDFGIGITGIAGPTGATKNKPIGLVYAAISTNKETKSFKFIFKGTRATIKSLAATKALRLLLKFIS